MSSLKVLGVGTIVLEVFRSPLRDKYRELILHNVLHTPESLCNTFSIELYEGYYHRGQHIGKGSDSATRPMFYTRPFLHNLQRLVLKNEPLGCSPLTEAHEKGRIPFAKAIRLDEKNRKVLESVILRGHTHSLPEPVRLPPSLSILLEEMQEDRDRENAALAKLNGEAQSVKSLEHAESSDESMIADNAMLSAGKKRKRVEETQGSEI
jgi:hypothetical protein